MKAELAARIVGGLKEAGISFVSYLPETRLSQILPLMREDPSFMVVPVANESEAVSIAAGASLGGRPAAVYAEGRPPYIWRAAEFTSVLIISWCWASGLERRCSCLSPTTGASSTNETRFFTPFPAFTLFQYSNRSTSSMKFS